MFLRFQLPKQKLETENQVLSSPVKLMYKPPAVVISYPPKGIKMTFFWHCRFSRVMRIFLLKRFLESFYHSYFIMSFFQRIKGCSLSCFFFFFFDLLSWEVIFMKGFITVGNIRKVLVIVQDCMEIANLDTQLIQSVI